MNVILKLLESRKNLQVGAGAAAGGLVYLIPVFIQLLGGDKVAGTIQHTSDAMALVAVALGVILAVLTAAEDMARKWGVTVPPPAEKAHHDLEELKKKFDEMAAFVRTQVPQTTSTQPDGRTPVKE